MKQLPVSDSDDNEHSYPARVSSSLVVELEDPECVIMIDDRESNSYGIGNRYRGLPFDEWLSILLLIDEQMIDVSAPGTP